jgi:putative PIN family toxin of toxin-antitoxin system
MAEKPSAVFDTGIVLQAALRPAGPAGRLLSLLDQDLFTISISEEVIAEYEDVLARPSIRKRNPHLTEELARAIIERLRGHAVLQPAPPRHFQYARDPVDEHVINLAIETNARYLVTRDEDLLDLMDENRPEGRLYRQRFPGLTILNPVAFLQVIAPQGDRES